MKSVSTNSSEASLCLCLVDVLGGLVLYYSLVFSKLSRGWLYSAACDSFIFKASGSVYTSKISFARSVTFSGIRASVRHYIVC